MLKYGFIGAMICLVALSGAGYAQEGDMLKLPDPVTKGGKPLMQALQERHSTREFSPKALSTQELANLLWAAAGVNRPDSGKRTAPSARDWREIDIYVTLADGVYRYDANKHELALIKKEDIRASTGVQDFVAKAPVNLVYVADFSRMEEASQEQKILYAGADTGFIAQNVYLFCASEGLATVVRGSVDREALTKQIGLRKHQWITLAQTVGYPAQ